MNIYLLTHQRELQRKTNTGAMVAKLLGPDCTLFIWDRVTPNASLLQKIKDESVALVYPDALSVSPHTAQSFDSYIILDGTWQETQKMYNHSPYLKDLVKVTLEREKPSIYTLRRNQKTFGLCTAECVIEILKANGQTQHSKHLEQDLKCFITSAC